MIDNNKIMDFMFLKMMQLTDHKIVDQPEK